ncbi:Protein Yae1-like [Manis pentadactyla]|nr:Protein Yae1-like [Manis pentadactyla]
MSWIQGLPWVRGPGVEGDVFDEEADEALLVQREWRSHMQRRVKEGYRDGVDAGKAVTLQQGFNQGYKEGADVIINYGQLRGTLSALLSWCHLHDSTSALISKINNLLDAVGQCEECCRRPSYSSFCRSQRGASQTTRAETTLRPKPAQPRLREPSGRRTCGVQHLNSRGLFSEISLGSNKQERSLHSAQLAQILLNLW